MMTQDSWDIWHKALVRDAPYLVGCLSCVSDVLQREKTCDACKEFTTCHVGTSKYYRPNMAALPDNLALLWLALQERK